MNKKMKLRRVEMGFTQKDLAEKAGLSRASIVQIERGTQIPSVETAERIANALKTTLEKIFA